MKRRSKLIRKGDRARRAKAPKPPRAPTPDRAPVRSSAASEPDELARITRERDEALEQQMATAKVLEVISRSEFELKAVFEALVESSVRLCGAERGVIYRFDGETLAIASSYNAPPRLVEWIKRHPIRPSTESTSGRATARAALSRRTVYIPDVDADPAYSSGGIAIDPARTFLAVPVLKGDTLLGVITRLLPIRPRLRSRTCGCWTSCVKGRTRSKN
jgi:GAF domain-containing protein